MVYLSKPTVLFYDTLRLPLLLFREKQKVQFPVLAMTCLFGYALIDCLQVKDTCPWPFVDVRICSSNSISPSTSDRQNGQYYFSYHVNLTQGCCCLWPGVNLELKCGGQNSRQLVLITLQDPTSCNGYGRQAFVGTASVLVFIVFSVSEEWPK